jgi:hypothetical protein
LEAEEMRVSSDAADQLEALASEARAWRLAAREV